MTSKRDQDQVFGEELVKQEVLDSEPRVKRHRGADQSKSKAAQQNAETDPTTGQRYAFGGLHDADYATVPFDEELDVEDEQDALAYLRSVRNQATGIPHLLIAPKAGPQLPPPTATISSDDAHTKGASPGEDGEADDSIFKTDQVDTLGFYADGAYAAYPDETSADRTDPEEFAIQVEMAREESRAAAYYDDLIQHFASLRAQLHEDPNDEVLATLSPATHPTEVGAFGPDSKTFGVWTHLLRTTDPHPAQIAAMDKTSVLRVLRVLHGAKFLRKGIELRERTSQWLWSLLARLPDRGELDSGEIGVVRELGKRAVAIVVGLVEMEVGEDEEEDEEGDADHEEEMEDHEEDHEYRARSVARNSSSEPDLVDAESNAVHGPGVAAAEVFHGKERNQANERRDEKTLTVLETEDVNVAGKHGDGGHASDLEEGEISDSEGQETEMTAAKERLLKTLEATGIHDDQEDGLVMEPEPEDGDVGELDPQSSEARAQETLRTTLNMILTVAGEFYGQRDLLEFREPFFADE